MDKKITIPVNENGMLENHFGQTRLFAFYQVKDNKIESKEVLTPPEHAPGVLPKWLHEKQVTDILAFTMGDRAQRILEHFKIKVHMGSPKLSADDLIKGFLDNSIEFKAELCHHDHDHHHHHHHNSHHKNR